MPDDKKNIGQKDKVLAKLSIPLCIVFYLAV